MKDPRVVFFILKDQIAGGVSRYMANLGAGLLKIGKPADFVFLDGRSNKTCINYMNFGLNDNLYALNRPEDAVDYINQYADIVVYARPHFYDDIAVHRSNPDLPKRYYDTILKINKPSVAFLHGTYCYTKYSPWIDVWENVCSAFIANKPILADMYADARGARDCYVIPIPIDCDKPLPTVRKKKLIVTTARIDSLKRQFHIVHAMRKLPNWKLKMYYGEYNFFTLKALKQLAVQANTEFLEQDTAFTLRMLDDFYEDAALLYNSTHFPDGHGGGMECVTMEGAIRGAVPLLTKEWVAPWPGAPGEDACYKFDIMSKALNGTENNLPDIINDIDPQSSDYLRRQANAYEFVKTNYSDRVVCRKFHRLLSNLAGG